MCKADYVHTVNEIMSNGGLQWALGPALLHVVEMVLGFLCVEYGFGSSARWPKALDTILFWYIIIVTDGFFQGRQTPPSPPTGCPAPPPRSGHCRTVPGQQLLRFQRFDQIGRASCRERV